MRALPRLDITWCDGLSDGAFVHLAGLGSLTMDDMGPYTCITDAAFSNLRGLKHLSMTNYRGVSDAAFAHIGPRLVSLGICGCTQLSGAIFANMPLLEELDISDCNQPAMRDESFALLPSLLELRISRCSHLTDAAFRHFTRVRTLDMTSCNQPGSTSAAFSHLSQLEDLVMDGVNQPSVGDAALARLTAVSCPCAGATSLPSPTLVCARWQACRCF
jgi:hypothetical protein